MILVLSDYIFDKIDIINVLLLLFIIALQHLYSNIFSALLNCMSKLSSCIYIWIFLCVLFSPLIGHHRNTWKFRPRLGCPSRVQQAGASSSSSHRGATESDPVQSASGKSAAAQRGGLPQSGDGFSHPESKRRTRWKVLRQDRNSDSLHFCTACSVLISGFLLI